jgi:hypothetical protein
MVVKSMSALARGMPYVINSRSSVAADESAVDPHSSQRNPGAPKAIICSIHQPSSAIVAHFDKVMLLAEGRVAFHGTSADALRFFTRCVSLISRIPKHTITSILHLPFGLFPWIFFCLSFTKLWIFICLKNAFMYCIRFNIFSSSVSVEIFCELINLSHLLYHSLLHNLNHNIAWWTCRF